MAEFTAHYFVPRPRITLHINAPHVNTPARIHKHGECSDLFALVGIGNRIYVGERVAIVAQPITDGFDRIDNFLARERFARLEQQQRTHFVLGYFQVAGKFDLTQLIDRAFGDGEGDVDFFLVWRDRYLRRINIEFQVTPVQIVGSQLFQIAGQFLFGILVILGKPGEPAAGG